jgi:catechol 2,3-dioxygenase-like lactoylglutathione lyase family enzyme
VILGIDHVQITVPIEAEREARDFYCGILGLMEIEKPENRQGKGGFWVQISGVQVHISLESGIDRSKTRAHVAYRVSDLDFWRKKLLENSIQPIESLPFPMAKAVEFRDPFGNRVELIQTL